MNKTTLEQQITKYNELYRAGTPAITNKEYDELVEQYEKLFPDSSFMKAILEKPKESRKRELPIRMGSLNKLKSVDELLNWLETLPKSEDIIITPKFDGISLLVSEANGDAYTRGDGFVGQYCNKHYQKLNESTISFEARYSYGEAIMSKNSFKKFSDKYANARNLVAGLFNRDVAGEELGDVDYLRYGVEDFSGNMLNKKHQIDICNNLNSVKVQSYMSNVLEFLYLGSKKISEQLNYLFETWSAFYDIDGLVIDANSASIRKEMGRESNGNPAYARAIKLPEWSSSAIVKVKGVTWGVSKQGKLKPVVNIEPTLIAGATISNVTGYNAKYVFDNNIAEGSLIEIVRSGDVIPKHIKTLTFNVDKVNDLADLVVECPSCGRQTKWDSTMTELVCTNPACDEKRINKLVHFFTTLKVEDFGAPSIRKFYQAGFKSVFDILNMGESEMNGIDGWGDKSSVKLISQFDKLSNEGVSFARLLHALDVMEGKLGEKMIQAILDGIDFNNWVGNYPLDEVAAVKGVSIISAGVFKSGVEAYFIRYAGIPVLITHTKTPKVKVAEGAKLTGFNICFTGVRPSADQETFIRENGGNIVSGVSKTTTHLVVKDKNSTSSKMKKAQSLGVKIMTIDELF